MTPSRVRSRWDMTPNMNQTPVRGGSMGGMSVLKETPTPGHMGIQTPNMMGETPTSKRQMRGRWDDKGLGETPTGQTPGMGQTPGQTPGGLITPQSLDVKNLTAEKLQ